jgi:hypothetical protein
MKNLVAALIIVSASGCATQSFVMTPNEPMTPTKEVMQPFFVSGIGQTQELDPVEICGGIEKVGKVETHMSFMDGLLGALTTGIYTPRQATVYCIQPSS